MELNLLSAGIAISTLVQMFFYWAVARNKWLRAAYLVAVFNGSLLIWINWVIAAPGRVPEIGLSGVEMTSDTSATNIFSILCVWIVISGFRGLWRLKHDKKEHSRDL